MSAFSSIYSSLSGLFGFSSGLDNASDNIANINTPGYKGRDLNFRDLTSETGEGIGVNVSGSNIRSQQGDINETGNATDLALDGEGFFVLRDGDDVVYTRSGQFQFDDEGYLIDPASGRRVAALTATGQLVDVRVDRARVSAAVETTLVSLIGNLDSQLAQGETYPGDGVAPIEFEIVDALGESHTLRVSFTKGQNNSWLVQLYDANGIALGNRFQIAFDEDTGLPLSGENTFEFSFQPFDLVNDDDYDERNISSTVVEVQDGDLATAADVVLNADEGYSLLVSSGEDEGVEIAPTRQFRFDAEGNLIDPATGRTVQALTTEGELTDFSIVDLLSNEGEASSRVLFNGNFNATLQVGETMPTYQVEVIDGSGALQTLSIVLTKGVNNTWELRVEDLAGNVLSDGGIINFDTNGNPTAALVSFDFTPFAPFTALPTDQVLNNGSAAILTTPGAYPSSGSLALSVNDAGKDADAFFLLRENGQFNFLQTGSFTIDSDGFLVTGNGNRLTTIDANGLVTDVNFSSLLRLDGAATTTAALSGNFDPAEPIGTTFSADPGASPLVLTVYDDTGAAVNLNLQFEKLQANQWQATITNSLGEEVRNPIILDFDPVTGQLLTGAATQISYQPAVNLSATDFSNAITLPPPINVTGGDPTTSVPAVLSLDQTGFDNGGYFVTRNGSDASLIANGSFVFDNNGFLIDQLSGQRVAGLTQTGLLQDININSQLVSPAIATSNVQLSGTLDTSDPNPQSFIVSAFDANGGTHDLTLSLTQSGTSNSWSVVVVDENGDNIPMTSGSTNAVFSSAGIPLITNVSFNYDPLATGTPTILTFNFSAVRSPTTTPQPFALAVQSNNGRASGELSQFEFTDQGELQLSYSNGASQSVATLAIRELGGSALDLSLNLALTEDPNFGSAVSVNSVDGTAEGLLASFSIDSSGAIQLEYSNGSAVQGPAIAVVEHSADASSTIAFDFSPATSDIAEASDLTVGTIDGIASGEISSYQFDENGLLQITYSNGEEATGPRIALAEETGSYVDGLTVNFGTPGEDGGVTSRATGSSNVSVGETDGRVAGNITNITFDENGNVVAGYSNGEEETIQRLAIATVTDINKLTPTSGSFFRAGESSGLTLGYANEDSFGSLVPKSLELSNVDLTSEFGNIIIIQRGYQAASQALNATNKVIEELYNTLKGG